MDQESFESLIKSKFHKEGIKAPKSVWNGLSGSLNDEALRKMQASQARFRWLAVAAVLLAILSFAVNIGDRVLGVQNETASGGATFNALLPSSPQHFRFFENNPSQTPSIANWSTILFVREDSKPKNLPLIIEDLDRLDPTNLFELEKKMPLASLAFVENRYYGYAVPQRRVFRSNKGSDTKFWAGIEAGAGSFNPEYIGSDPLSGSVNFDALASNIGQSGFVNPTSSAVQNGMNEGVSTSLGLDFGMKMGKKWTLESGVQYTSVQNQSSASLNVVDIYTISGNEVFTSDGDLGVPIVAPSARQTEVEENFDHSINLENSLRFTSIPLKAGYFIMDDKLSLRLNAGFSANYFLSNSLSDPTGQIDASAESVTYNEWSFDGLTGFELGFSLMENLNMTIEPNYRQSITPLSKNLVNRSGFMVQTGFRYTIR